MPRQREDETIERYLQRLAGYLSSLPAHEREEALREIGQHLDLLAEDASSAGEPEAARAALKRFGDAKRIARMLYWEALRQEWRRRKVHLVARIATRHPKFYIYFYIGLLCCAQFANGTHRWAVAALLIEAFIGVLMGISVAFSWVSARERVLSMSENGTDVLK